MSYFYENNKAYLVKNKILKAMGENKEAKREFKMALKYAKVFIDSTCKYYDLKTNETSDFMLKKYL